MAGPPQRKVIPVDLAYAGEARYFVVWCATVAGLGGGRLRDLAVAAEAVLTDVLLSAPGGVLEVEPELDEGVFRVVISHPALEARRMSGLEKILDRFLDGYEISPTRAVLAKRL